MCQRKRGSATKKLASKYRLTNQMQKEERESESNQMGERNVNTWQTNRCLFVWVFTLWDYNQVLKASAHMTRAHFRATYPLNSQANKPNLNPYLNTCKTPNIKSLICPSLHNAKRKQGKCNKFNLCTERGAGEDLCEEGIFFFLWGGGSWLNFRALFGLSRCRISTHHFASERHWTQAAV